MSILCMKTRTCLLLLTFVVGLLCMTFLYSNQESNNASSWGHLVSKTHKHLRDLNENPQRHKATEADLYLKRLGFYVSDDNNVGGESIISSSITGGSLSSGSYSYGFNVLSTEEAAVTWPVIVIPVLSGQGILAGKLLHSIRQHLPDYVVNIYDLGLGYYERQELIALCANISTPSLCMLKPFVWEQYPSHISQTKYEAYRPIIIQETLNSSGAAFYLSPNQLIKDKVPEYVLQLARSKGVAAWGLQDSSSAITHPKTFAFFHTDSQPFYFHRTIRGDRLIVYNTDVVRKQLMLPWLQCTLTYRCLSPLGAQDTGCRSYRRPLYLYSGCHHYDWSVLNVVLGLLFKYSTDSYTVPSSNSFLMDPEK